MKDHFKAAMLKMQMPPLDDHSLGMAIQVFAMGWLTCLESKAMLLAAEFDGLKWMQSCPNQQSVDDSWKWWIQPKEQDGGKAVDV